MRTSVILFNLSLCACLLGCKSNPDTVASQAANIQHLDSLYEHHHYFQLRDTLKSGSFQLGERDELLLKAKLHSVFNERAASNALIEQLLTKYETELSEAERLDLLETRIVNSVFLFDYSEALDATEELLTSDSLSEENRKEHLNTQIIYRSLQDAPAQAVQLEKTELPITKDLAGLSRIPVEINTTRQEVVFDTGANFSVITDSLALKSGMEIIGETFGVKAVTGGEVNSRIGIADSLRLGNTLLKNVVFLVFPEESLSFPEANYTIDAILGFPVINALKEVMLIDQEKFLITGGTSDPTHQNLSLDFLTPIVEVFENGTSLPFTFDTGANTTAFYEEYFNLRKEKILEKGSKDSLQFGGAGGVIKIPVYYVPFKGRIGESSFQLDSAAVRLKNTSEYPGIYGNLGQDVLSQFDTLLIDFEDMAFDLK